ncbi:hypothetical protein CU098_002874, partial [Rhizopus stolonifer]
VHMSCKDSVDVVSQIRDLQSFIDDFASEEAGTTALGDPEKIQITEEPIMLQKPNEKTLDDIEQTREEKTLIESSPVPEPLSFLSCDLNLSEDFTSLVNQFKQLKVPAVVIPKENCQMESVIITASDSPIPEDMHSQQSFYSQQQKSQTSRRPSSASSKKSTKSGKSQKSIRSARRLQNERKLQQQSQQSLQESIQKKPSSTQKYVERSYDEMMRIPDIYERLSFYEKTLDLCLKEESPFKSWVSSNQEKGKPQPLLEDYVPPIRTPEISRSNNSSIHFGSHMSGNMSSSFSGSISMFLKKATIGSTSFHSPHNSNFKRPNQENKPFLANQNYVHTPQVTTGGSGIFGRSISRFNLIATRSTQLPRYTRPTKPSHNRMTPILNNRVGATPTASKKINARPSPLNTNRRIKTSPSSLINTPTSSASSPSSFYGPKSSSTNSSDSNVRHDNMEGIDYLTTVLPQIDIRILQKALEEANGDSMVAISTA